MELDIALTTLQHRLQARRGAHERPHGHRHHIHIAPHPSSLNSGLPLLFFRQIASVFAIRTGHVCIILLSLFGREEGDTVHICHFL